MILKNPKWERFARLVAEGKDATAAYLGAGFKANPKIAKVNACKLWGRPEVRARVAELSGKADEKIIEKIALTREWVIARLTENVQRAMQLQRTPEGGEFRYDGAVANRALELLGKEIGMFTERTENTNTIYGVSDKPMTEAEWVKQYGGAPEDKAKP